MKIIFLKQFLLSMIVLCFFHEVQAQYYISPSGNDANSGISEGAAWATINGALSNLVNTTTSGQGNESRPVIVNLMDGVYPLQSPILITPDMTDAINRPVIFRAINKGNVFVNGGVKITTSWQPYKNGIWKTKLNKAMKFKELFVNGQRRFRAHSPNTGFYTVNSFPDNDTAVNPSTPGRKFGFAGNDISSSWRNLQDVEVVVYHFFKDSQLPIESVDDANKIVTFQFDASRVFTDGWTTNGERSKNGARYIVNNVFEGLDEPGEWYLDESTQELYYMPKPGEDMKNLDIWAPALSELVNINGIPLAARWVQNVHFEGITFQYAQAYLPPGNSNNAQSAKDVPAAINLTGAINCSFRECTLTNLGGYAIDFSDGCKEDSVISSTISHVGAGGIRINGGRKMAQGFIEDISPLLRTGENVFTDNRIHDFGEMYASGTGILLRNAYENKILHNEIHDGYYIGISVGWRWDYYRSVSWGNKIAFNHIYNIGRGLLSDMGAIYTLTASPGTVINNNLIHDVQGHVYGGWGIYNDQGSAEILIKNNIVYKTSSGSYFNHLAKNIWVKNNIFSLGEETQVEKGNVVEKGFKSLYFENNIVYWKKGDLLTGIWKDIPYIFHFNPRKNGDREVKSTFDMDWNIYYNPTISQNGVKFMDNSWQQWNALGKDAHSIYMNPLFEDPENYNFTLKPESPAFRIGFQPIDMTTVGPRD